jgi:uncharacterized protein YbgA (DUF1722 family)
VRSKIDHTDRMNLWAQQRVEELASENICGFIFKSNSPSSGLERIKVYGSAGAPRKVGIGLFARAFTHRFPLLPVEDEGRLHDPVIRENFIERLFVYKRWQDLQANGLGRSRLVDFHTRHKLQILAHDPQRYRLMGKLVAHPEALPLKELYGQYADILMPALRMTATARKHSNVLQHMLGYFKMQLTPDEKQELLQLIERYRQGSVPLVVPVTLMSHYVRKFQQPYLMQQWYLDPHPVELQLRNHV